MRYEMLEAWVGELSLFRAAELICVQQIAGKRSPRPRTYDSMVAAAERILAAWKDHKNARVSNAALCQVISFLHRLVTELNESL